MTIKKPRALLTDADVTQIVHQYQVQEMLQSEIADYWAVSTVSISRLLRSVGAAKPRKPRRDIGTKRGHKLVPVRPSTSARILPKKKKPADSRDLRDEATKAAAKIKAAENLALDQMIERNVQQAKAERPQRLADLESKLMELPLRDLTTLFYGVTLRKHSAQMLSGIGEEG